MPSLSERVAERYARNQAEKTQEVRGVGEKAVQGSGQVEPSEPVQAAHDQAGTGRGRAPASRPERALSASEKLQAVRAVMGGQEDKPEADIEVDGKEMDTDWDESSTDWMNSQKAAVRKAMEALGAQTIDMVAAIHKNKLLGAVDARKYGAKDIRLWGHKVDGPFELVMLRKVPVDQARLLTDFPARKTRWRDPKQAWRAAEEFADPRPFKRSKAS